MTDQTRPNLSETHATAASAEAAVLAPRIIAFNVPGCQAKCGNDPYSAAPRFLYTHTVDDTPEAVAAFMAANPRAVKSAGPMRLVDLQVIEGKALDYDMDS